MQDHASKTKGMLWVIGACLIALLFIFGISALAQLVPWGMEMKMARMLNSTISHDAEITDEQTTAILNKIVKRIYPVRKDDGDFSINVHIVKSPVVNAYTELGGSIVLNTGLIKQARSPEEISGVLAHEIEHVRHRHIMEGLISRLFSFEMVQIIFTGNSSMATLTNMLFNMKFSRQEEAQADIGALERLQQAHVDNHGFKDFFLRMEHESGGVPAWLSDHPSDDERVHMVDDFKNQDVRPVLSDKEWGRFKESVAGK